MISLELSMLAARVAWRLAAVACGWWLPAFLPAAWLFPLAAAVAGAFAGWWLVAAYQTARRRHR